MSLDGLLWCRKHRLTIRTRCDGPPDKDSSRRSQNPQIEASTPSVISPRSSVSSLSTISDASTPVSELLTAAPALPQIDPVAEARRRQSDAASAAIGSRLLKGWILLAQECVNPSCHGIPLMKRPKARPTGSGQPEHIEESKKNRKFASTSASTPTLALPDPRKSVHFPPLLTFQ